MDGESANQARLRRTREAQERRLAAVDEARNLATHLKDKVGAEAGAMVGEPAEEIAGLTTAVSWLAAELRAGRLEHHDRVALTMETGYPLRRGVRRSPHRVIGSWPPRP